MDNIVIKTGRGEQLSVNVVRYFRLNGGEYLVFSLNEVDDGGYVKLYIAKINGEIANTITDDVEWNLIKDTVKTIIKSNKENLPLSITDLDVKKLVNIQVVDQKVFKLSETFIQLLGANKNVEPYIEPTITAFEPTSPMVDSTNELDHFNLNSIQPNPIMDSISTIDQTVNTEPNLSQSEIIPSVANEQSVINDFTNLPRVGNETMEENISTAPQIFADNFENVSAGSQDYKSLYESELSKNEILTVEVEKYKAIIKNLKNIINE